MHTFVIIASLGHVRQLASDFGGSQKLNPPMTSTLRMQLQRSASAVVRRLLLTPDGEVLQGPYESNITFN